VKKVLAEDASSPVLIRCISSSWNPALLNASAADSSPQKGGSPFSGWLGTNRIPAPPPESESSLREDPSPVREVSWRNARL